MKRPTVFYQGVKWPKNDLIMITMTLLVAVMKLAWKCTAGIAAVFYRWHLPTLNSL
jgi:hypothetical protein